jgi:hypothetical protein
MIKNCTVPPFCDTGSPPSTSCATSTRTVDIPPTAVPQPNGLVQPGLGAGDANSGQWLFIDVTNVLCLASALGCDGI